jgi:hypothetical protein
MAILPVTYGGPYMAIITFRYYGFYISIINVDYGGSYVAIIPHRYEGLYTAVKYGSRDFANIYESRNLLPTHVLFVKELITLKSENKEQYYIKC